MPHSWIQRACREGLLISRRRVFAITGVFSASFFGSLLFFKPLGMPFPIYHDEFSYLLAADTFSKGRLTNPPHPMGQHFESFHILQEPTYMSAYPPAQGSLLALGKKFLGHPAFGIWLSVGLMSAALCWMLYGWLPPRWAFAGSVLACLHLGIYTYWSYTYWGGALAAAGGALVYGGLRRVIRKGRTRDAVFLGLGLALLANTRPFDGLIASLPALGLLTVWFFRKIKSERPAVFSRVLLPLALVLLLTAGGMMHYNTRITGRPFKSPYQQLWETYTRLPLFLWQPLRPEIAFRHKIFQQFDESYLGALSERKNLKKELETVYAALKLYAAFYLRPVFLVLLIAALPWIVRSRWTGFALGTALAGWLVTPAVVSWAPLKHYAAPVVCLWIYLVIEALRRAARLRWIGPWIVFALLGAWSYETVREAAASRKTYRSLQTAPHLMKIRNELIDRWTAQGGKHLGIVRYSQGHNMSYDWVYNEADIDNAPVVWAREMDPVADQKLLEYFRGRTVWLVTLLSEDTRVSVEPYPDSSPSLKPLI